MPSDIIRLEAKSAYTLVYFDGQPPFTVSKVLKTFEELLRPYGFVRTHRSYLVNRLFVRSILGDTISMQDAFVAEICRRNKRCIIRQLNGNGHVAAG